MAIKYIDAKYQTDRGRVMLIRIPPYFISHLNPEPEGEINLAGEVLWKTHGRRAGWYARGCHLAHDQNLITESGEKYKITKYSFYPLLTPTAILMQLFAESGYLYLDGLPWRQTSSRGEGCKGGLKFFRKMGWLDAM
jgi:hypothetical protein